MLIVLLLVSTCSFAQGTDSVRHAIGLFAESNGMFSGSNVPEFSTVGVQYNKRTKKYFGYKLMLGFGTYNDQPNRRITSFMGDTLREQKMATKIKLGVLGGGITWERQFYNRLHFFASIDARIGHGHGKQDSTFYTEYYRQVTDPITGITTNSLHTSERASDGPATDMFYAALTPSFGLELKWRRLCIGTEFMNYVTFTSIHVHGSPTIGNLDFNSGNLTQRFFIQYRF